jgi:ribosomal protein S18 acetylase RimI-like enzyme
VGSGRVPVADPADILGVFTRDAPAHPYGIADVAQLWERSRWWRAGDAVVGLMDLPGSDVPVLYAVSADAAEATLDLLRELEPQLPSAVMATGPVGLAAALAPDFAATFARAYVKLHLADAERLPPPDPLTRVLTRRDLPALEALYATDPVAGDFFHAALLDTGLYLGRWDGAELVATSGIHVLDEQHGVAAIGNVATHPAHRRRGLGRAVTATLCHHLLRRVPVVGLNVRQENVAARRLYLGMGFRIVLPYEEAKLIRRNGAASAMMGEGGERAAATHLRDGRTK